VDGFSPGRLYSDKHSINCFKVLDSQGSESSAEARCWDQDIWYQGDIMSKIGSGVPYFADDGDVKDILQALRSGKSNSNKFLFQDGYF